MGDDVRRMRGSGSVYYSGKRWMWRLRKAGGSVVRTLMNDDGTPCRNKREAVASAKRFQRFLLAESTAEAVAQIATVRGLLKKRSVLVCEVFNIYRRLPSCPDVCGAVMKAKERDCRNFVEWLGEFYPGIEYSGELTPEIGAEYMAYVWRRGVSARTHNGFLFNLRSIFRDVFRAEKLECDNPFDGIAGKPLEVVSHREFTIEQVRKIFGAFDTGFFYDAEMERLGKGRERERVFIRTEFKPLFKDEMFVLLHLCCWIGCRCQDGCLMRWGNISDDLEKITFAPRKTARKTNHRAVSLPLHPQLMEALKLAEGWRGANKRGEDFILPNVAERFLRNPSGITKDVQKIISCALGVSTKAAGYEVYGQRMKSANRYGIHSFRHTFASFCMNAGVPLEIIADLVGHGSPVMTRVYSHAGDDARAAAIAALPRL